MKRPPTEWEKIFANDISDKRLICQIYKEIIQLNIKKSNNLIKKWTKILNRHFFQKRQTDDQQEAEKMLNSVSLIITQMQIKTTRRYTSHLSEWLLSKTTNNKCWRGCGEKGTLEHCWWECKLVKPLWTAVWRFLKKLKRELPYNPSIPLPLI